MTSPNLRHEEGDVSSRSDSRSDSCASTDGTLEPSTLLTPVFETPALQSPATRAQAQASPELATQTIKTEATATVISPKPQWTVPQRRCNHWLTPKPLLGIVALAVGVACVFFSLAILVTSNNRPVSNWSIQPTVYLAIASAVANSAVTFAFAQAAVVAWWYRASKGATVRALERQWEASFTLSHAIFRLRDLNFPMVAGLLVASMIADGPLLQRASSVIVATQSETVALNFSLTPELPTGFSGNIDYSSIFVTSAAIDTARDWTSRTAIPFSVSPSCEGNCVGKVKGPGMTRQNCSTSDWPITYAMYHDANATWGGDTAIFFNDTVLANPLFEISLDPHDIGKDDGSSTVSEAVNLQVGTIHVVNSTGKYSQTTCWLVPAIIEYDVLFTSEGNIELLPDSHSSSKVVSLANNTHAYNLSNLEASQPDTLGWLMLTLETFVGANCSAEPPLPGADPHSPSGVWDMNFLDYNSQCSKYINWTAVAKETYLWDGTMDLSFRDPTLDIMQSFNEMLLRAAVLASSWSNVTHLIDPGLSIHQSTLANQTVTRNVFHSDFRWYGAATALELVVILAVLPLFWGWWTLDRHLTLSPFSLGLAFNAPILEGVDPSRGPDGVVEELGHMHVRYDSVFPDKRGRLDSEAGSLSSRSGFLRA